jgi:hypothetical protein
MQGKQCGLWAGLYMTARFDPTHTIRSLVTPRNSNWEAWLTPTVRLSLITRSFNGNTVRNFPTHGQLPAAQGSLTSCLNFDFAILNLFEPSAP